MPREVTIGEAARMIGVSADTLRRWDRAGKLRTKRNSRNQRLVSLAEVRRHGGQPERHRAGDEVSARNRLPGVVTSVEVDGVMGIVEIQAGPFRVSAAITRDAIDELGLEEGVEATAMVKATSVMLIREGARG
jgi:molybdopterin-binding protein